MPRIQTKQDKGHDGVGQVNKILEHPYNQSLSVFSHF